MRGIFKTKSWLIVLFLSLVFSAAAQKYNTVKPQYITFTPIGAYEENSNGDVISDLGKVEIKIGIYYSESASEIPRISIDLKSLSVSYLACFEFEKGRSAYDYTTEKDNSGNYCRVFHLLTNRRNEIILTMWMPYNFDSEGSLFFNFIDLKTGRTQKCYEVVLSARDSEQVFKTLAKFSRSMNFRKWTNNTRDIDIY